MFTRTTTLFLIAVFASGCQQGDQSRTACHQLFMQEEVSRLGVEELYKEAMWQVYKFNLIDGDRFEVKNPFYVDSIYTENSLSEFDLEFYGIQKSSDTVAFSFIFDRGVYPADYPYYGTVSFWGDEEKMEIGDRYIFTMERSAYEPEFRKYLRKNKERLSPMLKCLAAERGCASDFGPIGCLAQKTSAGFFTQPPLYPGQTDLAAKDCGWIRAVVFQAGQSIRPGCPIQLQAQAGREDTVPLERQIRWFTGLQRGRSAGTLIIKLSLFL